MSNWGESGGACRRGLDTLRRAPLPDGDKTKRLATKRQRGKEALCSRLVITILARIGVQVNCWS
jgi:hypothetical protein